jgi:hypothetical protein
LNEGELDMPTPDLSPLVKGIIVIIGIAVALGQYPKLESWAKGQAIEAVAWKQGLPYFFPQNTHHKVLGHARAHP